MVSINVDGPSGRCNTQYRGIGGIVKVELALGIACILDSLEEDGIPINEFIEDLSKDIGTAYKALKEHKNKERKDT